jgi:hypothetical protein
MDKDIFEILAKIDINKIDFSNIQLIKMEFCKLFNVIEKLVAENKEKDEQIQNLKNELNILKGEKGKPDIKPNKDESTKNKVIKLSEKDREKKKWKKKKKNELIKIDREEIIEFDKSKLPSDAEFKGYNTRVVQNIIIKTDNVCYKMETYYSKSEGRSYTADLPEYLGNSFFGSELKAYIHSMYYECRVTEPKITELLVSCGIQISEGTVSDILIYDKIELLIKEKKSIFEAAVEVSQYHQIDDTGMRVNGVNHYATILCNQYYSLFFIRRYKNRITVAKILCGMDENSEIDMDAIQTLIKLLIADDAPQFKKIVEELGLCWIHEERLYKKLIPVLQHNKDLLTEVTTQIWDFYDELKQYKLQPTESDKLRLSDKFDSIFTQTTGYEELDERLRLTSAKKESLLLVLKYPFLPLHNNESETSAREIVTKRKISGGVRTEAGKKALEVGLSIYATCKKNNVNYYDYILEIFKGNPNRLQLHDLITKNAIVDNIASHSNPNILEKPA